MSFKNEKNKNNSFLDQDKNLDKTVSDAINEAFDQVELSTVGKLCLDARLNKGLTQEQAAALLKVRVKIIKDFEDGEHIDLPGLAYKVGFVRSYARLLDLDGNLLVTPIPVIVVAAIPMFMVVPPPIGLYVNSSPVWKK